MVLPHGSGDLYHKYRPLRFSEVVGNKQVVSSLQRALQADQPSQAYLLTGDSGCGKTTSARIVALTLNCLAPTAGGEPCLSCKACRHILSGVCTDIIEVNCADHRGIDAIRSLCSTMPMMPLQLDKKVYILDEAQQLTKESQSSLLKELEEAPKHVFIVLCTTDPQKLLTTVKTRCQQFSFRSLNRVEMLDLLKTVSSFEGIDLPAAVLGKIVEAAFGSPRQALVLLQQVIQLEDQSLESVGNLLATGDFSNKEGFALCLSFSKTSRSWADLMTTYDSCRDQGATALGMMLAGFFRNKLIDAKSQQQAVYWASLLELFIHPFPEGKLGENALILNLYKAHTQK